MAQNEPGVANGRASWAALFDAQNGEFTPPLAPRRVSVAHIMCAPAREKAE
jgi:hypothetical protein